MATHTPGPWEVSKAKPTKTRGIDVLAKAGPHIVASVYQPAAIGDWNVEQIERARANARLIAAAPDLYEALKRLLVAAGPLDQQAARQYAESAIAKVEGRE